MISHPVRAQPNSDTAIVVTNHTKKSGGISCTWARCEFAGLVILPSNKVWILYANGIIETRPCVTSVSRQRLISCKARSSRKLRVSNSPTGARDPGSPAQFFLIHSPFIYLWVCSIQRSWGSLQCWWRKWVTLITIGSPKTDRNNLRIRRLRW